MATEPSNPFAVTTPAVSTGNYPNLPGNFNAQLFQHDCSFWPATNSGAILEASDFGFILPTGNGMFGSDGNDGGTFTGAIQSSRYARSGSAGHPHVEHGPLDPHGKNFCFRTRFSRGTSSGTANSNNAQMQFRAVDGGTAPQYRSIYMHFWVLFEGFDYDGAFSGPTRAIQRGIQYRLGFQGNNCPSSTNQGGLFVLGALSGTIWGVGADTGAQTDAFRTAAPISLGMGSVCRNTSQNCTTPLVSASGLPGTGAPGNGISGSMHQWIVGRGGSGVHDSNTGVPQGAIQVGRWHRVEVIFEHSDVNTENGSLRIFVDTELVGIADPITTRWSNFSFVECDAATGWYLHPKWYFGFHPGGSGFPQLPDNPHNRYCSFADFKYAGILA